MERVRQRAGRISHKSQGDRAGTREDRVRSATRQDPVVNHVVSVDVSDRRALGIRKQARFFPEEEVDQFRRPLYRLDRPPAGAPMTL